MVGPGHLPEQTHTPQAMGRVPGVLYPSGPRSCGPGSCSGSTHTDVPGPRSECHPRTRPHCMPVHARSLPPKALCSQAIPDVFVLGIEAARGVTGYGGQRPSIHNLPNRHRRLPGDEPTSWPWTSLGSRN